MNNKLFNSVLFLKNYPLFNAKKEYYTPQKLKFNFYIIFSLYVYDDIH